MEFSILPVILAGGSGSRLWPLSRSLYPKQFLPLTSEKTMLQETLLRLNGLQDKGIKLVDPIVICNEEHRFVVAEQVRAMGQDLESIILEPVGRNTAPAIALAAIEATRNKDDHIILVLAADHSIKNVDAFHEAIASARAFADDGHLVTFGVTVDKPETGYGYIKKGEQQLLDCQGQSFNASQIDSFVEKPSLEKAQEYMSSGEFLWNSGMFVFKASRYLQELEKFRPDILEACRNAMKETTRDLDFTRIDKDAFTACPDESIDYAVMERTDDARVVPLDASWSDVGSWSSLWEVCDKDAQGNVKQGDVLTEATSNSFIHAESRLVSTLGVDDLVVVETKDAVMVANKNAVQDVKKLVTQLKNKKRNEWSLSREVYRPWGKYDSVDEGTRHQVKRITVKPRAKLSVQMHYHRAEHWIVVKGTAKVRVGDETLIVSENESTYIPVGEVHSLENPGSIPLELIEVQSGSYLGEDDIVRFEDDYGRC